MQKIVKRKIGKETHQFMIGGNNLFECIQEERRLLGFYDIDKCGLCGKDNLYLTAYKTQEGYKYVKIVCADCKASLTFGTRSDDTDVYYPRKTEDKKLAWVKPPDTVEKAKEELGAEEIHKQNDDLPF